MAIDRMKKITVVCQATAALRLAKKLHELGIVELTDAMPEYEEARGELERDQMSTEDSDRELQRVNLILSLLDAFAPEQKSFVAGLATVPLVVEPKELEDALHKFEIDALYTQAAELDDIYRRTERAISDIQNQLKDLEPLKELPFNLADLRKTPQVKFAYGLMAQKNMDALMSAEDSKRILACEPVLPGRFHRKNGSAGDPGAQPAKKGDKVQVLFAFLADEEANARRLLSAHAFEEISLPLLGGTVRDHVRELEGDLAAEQAHIDEVAQAVRGFVDKRRPLRVLKAYHENRRQCALAWGNTLRGKWIHVLTGYMRERDVAKLKGVLAKDFPSASLSAEDPAVDAAVPVSISLPEWMRPIQMLINLFGLPNYSSFDPSPNIFFPFLMFFGICFSDVAYGTMLLLLSLYIMRKTRLYAGVYNFAKLLSYAGVSTIIFGFLLGSWFGDLYKPQYLGENNIMLRIMSSVQIIDPIEKPIVVLMIALLIGMLNQFYGIALKMYGAMKRGDKTEAICDGLFWLILLPGFVILVSKIFAPVPAAAVTVGLLLFAVGGIGLVLTQGRGSSGLVSRIMTGVISLYGIVGSYGITAFIGDTMSYCRLLALSLTTSIVALSFNIMADLLRDVPYVGFFLFILVLVIAHVFNFSISVLGAFVHSMRLIFVEFFGRFYSGGAKPFAPLGFDSRTAVLKKGS